MTPYTQIEKNVRKTFLLMSSFFLFVIGVGWVISQQMGEPMILYYAIGFSLFTNVTSYFFADKIALSSAGAKKANPNFAQDKQILRLVENLAITAGLPTPEVYIIEDDSINAFATGRGPKNASVAFTRGLLNKLNKQEQEGVAAHELSHIKNRDILLMTVVVVLVGFITLVADVFMRGNRAGIRVRSNRKSGGGMIVIIFILFIFISKILAKLLQLAISRKREFMADASGVLLTRFPEGLASALEKIKNQNIPLKKANSATAHMFISNPFGPEKNNKPNWLSRLFSTHPPIEERIEALHKMS